MLYIAAIAYVLHLFFEAMTIFVKYNFAANQQPMKGANVANILAILSRGFIATYGIIISINIESKINEINKFYYLMIMALIISGIISITLSKFKLNLKGAIDLNLFTIVNSKNYSRINKSNDLKIPKIQALFIGLQFVSVVFIFALCYIFYENRLTLISLTPLVSMAGALVTVLIVEARLASIVDKDARTAYEVSSCYLIARSASFFLAAAILSLFLVYTKIDF
jgi:hypothetical protein